MRVIFGHQRFGVQPVGGVSRYFFELAKGLEKLPDVHASIFAPFHVNRYLQGSPLMRPWSFHVPAFPGSGLPLGFANMMLSKVFVKPRRDVDVYHETYYDRFDYCPRRAARVLTVFDMIHELYPQNFPSLDRTRQIKERAIKRADHLVCISENTRRDLIRILGVPAEKTSVVHLGSSLDVREIADSPRENARPFLLYVGGRSGYKNFSGLLRAYAASPRLRREFRIVCFGGGRLLPEEVALCKSLGLVGNDILQESGSDQALVSAYRGAAMLVYPSLYEGFGLPPLEAMSVGCPVACSASSSIPEIVGEAGEYFDPLNPEDIRRSIEYLAGSPSRLRELVRLGRVRALDFSWERCASETLGIYRALVGKGEHASAIH